VKGVGVRLHHKRLGQERLETAVHTAITKRRGAERIAEAIAKAGGPSAAEAVEEPLAAPGATTRDMASRPRLAERSGTSQAREGRHSI